MAAGPAEAAAVRRISFCVGVSVHSRESTAFTGPVALKAVTFTCACHHTLSSAVWPRSRSPVEDSLSGACIIRMVLQNFFPIRLQQVHAQRNHASDGVRAAEREYWLSRTSLSCSAGRQSVDCIQKSFGKRKFRLHWMGA